MNLNFFGLWSLQSKYGATNKNICHFNDLTSSQSYQDSLDPKWYFLADLFFLLSFKVRIKKITVADVIGVETLRSIHIYFEKVFAVIVKIGKCLLCICRGTSFGISIHPERVAVCQIFILRYTGRSFPCKCKNILFIYVQGDGARGRGCP